MKGYSRLTPVQLAEIARRTRAGERQSVIADSMGLPRSTVGAAHRKFRTALGLPTAEQEIAAAAARLRAEVIRRVDAGETNDQIAKALGRTRSAVHKLRAELGLKQLRRICLTAAEEAEAKRRLMAGESTRDVAAALGCSQQTISVRRRRLLHRIPTDLMCECGKPQNHSSHCLMHPDKIVLLRQRLLEGHKVQHLAAEFGYSAQALRSHYAQPIIDELRAAGVTCGCGKRFAHNGQCVGTGSNPAVVAARDALKEKVEPLLREGLQRSEIAKRLGATRHRVDAVARRLVREWAADGILCGCGQPIDHPKVCAVRFNREHCGPGGRAGYVVYGTTALTISPDFRGRIRKMAIKGRSDAFIAQCLGIDDATVAAVVADQEAVGVQMSDCRCGLPRNHRAACRPPVRAPKSPRRRKGAGLKLTSEQRRRLMELYKSGTSAKQMVRVTGISIGVVGRLVRQWRDGRRVPLRPCPCGRPGRHPGSCAYRTLGGFDKRMLARSEELMREGHQPRAIARMLDVGVATLLKRTLNLRHALFAQGVRCGCGLILGHPFWCTATWDERGQPRGRQAIDPALAANVARALIAGDLVQDIAVAQGLPAVRVWDVRRELPIEDRKRRARVMRERLELKGDAAAADVLAEVQAAVPRGIDRMIRDDIVGELVLGRMSGRIEAAELKGVVRSFVNKGLSQWSGAYQKSADAVIRDGDFTLADTLADTTTFASLDHFEIGGSPPQQPQLAAGAPRAELSVTDRINLRALGLSVDADQAAVRRAFGDLARRYHPDQNGGDRQHEAELRRITEAYRQLKQSLGIREGPS